MFLALSLLVLAQAPVAEPIRLASVGFNQVRIKRDLAVSFEETFALRLAETGLVRVTTPRDVASILGVERQKQLLGCADAQTSCLAELAGALGAEGIITGEIALVGKVYQLTIKVLSPKDGRPLYQVLKRVKGEEEVLEELDRVAVDAAKKVTAALRANVPAKVVAPVPVPEPKPVVTEAPVVEKTAPRGEASAPRVAPWVVLAVGGAVLVGGAVTEGLAMADYATLRTAPVSTSLNRLSESGKTKQAIGLTLVGVGGAVVVGSLVWLLVGAPPQAPMISASISAERASVVVSGTF